MMHFLRAWLRKCDFKDGNHQREDKKIKLSILHSFFQRILIKVHICRVANGDLTWENLSYPQSHTQWYIVRKGHKLLIFKL